MLVPDATDGHQDFSAFELSFAERPGFRPGVTLLEVQGTFETEGATEIAACLDIVQSRYMFSGVWHGEDHGPVGGTAEGSCGHHAVPEVCGEHRGAAVAPGSCPAVTPLLMRHPDTHSGNPQVSPPLHPGLPGASNL